MNLARTISFKKILRQIYLRLFYFQILYLTEIQKLQLEKISRRDSNRQFDDHLSKIRYVEKKKKKNLMGFWGMAKVVPGSP